MSFEVLPAIDLSHGRLARLDKGTRAAMTAYDGDPLVAAAAFIDAGARWLHVVDMDLAFEGQARNLDLIGRLAAMGASVQASGGVTTRAHVDAFFAAGVDRVVLGTGAFADRVACEQMTTDLGDRLIAGLEAAESGWLVPRGQASGVRLPEAETIDWLETLPFRGYLRTSVARVGEMAGLDLSGLETLCVRSDKPVMAGGGVATMEDVRAVAGAGAAGVVLGRSLYDGALDLRQAIAIRAP